MSVYARLLKNSNASFSFFGFNFSLPLNNQPIDEVLEHLKQELQSINKKIVIIVDDLDRLDLPTIKDVLYVIKNAFTLPNISFILCYDTDNISLLEQKSDNSEKATEFMEKFINMKITLNLDSNLLFEYFTVNKNESLSVNFLTDREFVAKVADGLEDIFKSKDYDYYQPLIGDARKLKRLINTILLLEIEKTDFENFDINKYDLIHLLLIYINYPNIFRKIYNTETNGRKGFFSAVTEYEDGYPKSEKDSNDQSKYKNSVKYMSYIKGLTDNQRFILDRVFNMQYRLNDIVNDANINQEILTSFACFNGMWWSGGGRNLEQYLMLITKVTNSQKTDQYRFYRNLKDKIVKEEFIEDALKGEEFSFAINENNHQQLWKALINTPANEMSKEKSNEIIYYALNNLPQYSVLEIESEVGLRNSLTYYIVRLLDQIRWEETEDDLWNTRTTEHVASIAHWIFGEEAHKHKGVLDILGKEERGVLGFNDLLLFRLRCCVNRGWENYNLSSALALHGNPKARLSGDKNEFVIEEMREMSQNVFQCFKARYIDNEINIFEEIDNLTLEDVCGKYKDYIKLKIESNEIKDIETKLFNLKSRLKAFIVFQIGSSIIGSGIGCGYYDVSGNEDEKGINRVINDYLFGICFDAEKNEYNYMHFLDYLLINFSSTFGSSNERKYIPHINEFTKVLDIDQLTTYWIENGDTIRAKNYISVKRKVFTGNYVTSYDADLEITYNVLDQLVHEG